MIKNLAAVPSGTNFAIEVQMDSTSSAATITPTVSITTYYDEDHLVDTISNSPFSTTTITNTNRETFTSLEVENPQTVERKITKGYFGHLLFKFHPRTSSAVNDGYYLRFTFPNEFYPYSNQLNLPLICMINDVRQECDYTLAPFTVTMYDISSQFTTSENSINITTEYLDHNGIQYPTTQGRYLLEYEVIN